MKKSALKEAIKNEIKSVLSEDFNDYKMGLAQIKSSGETAGAMAINKELKREAFKNVPDMDAYADGFVKGAANTVDYLKSKLGQAIRGGGDEESLMGLVGLNESLNPEVSRAVDRFITAMADKYGYSMQDAVYAIMAALKQRNYDGLNEVEDMDDDEDDKKASQGAKKEKLGKQASKLSQADEDRYDRIKNGLEKLKKKGDEESIKKMKAILGKKDVEKLIKAKGRTKASFM